MDQFSFTKDTKGTKIYRADGGQADGGQADGGQASDLMDDALGMSGYYPDAMDKIIQADGGWHST